MHNRTVTLGIVALLSTALLTGCTSSESGPRIRDWPDGEQGMIWDDTTANTPYSLDDVTLCLTSPGSVTVEKVEPKDPTGGLRVTLFATRPAKQVRGEPFGYISDPKQSLKSVGYSTAGPATIHKVCRDDDEPATDQAGNTILAFEVTKPAAKTAKTSAFIITYRSKKKAHAMVVAYGITLCEGTAGSADCKL